MASRLSTLKWPAKHLGGVDPGLMGERAFDHPAVREWWRWLREDYRPRSSVALITPCSNVKPYTRSPTSRKIRGLLRRLGLWDPGSDRPRGVEWLYFSDLLILVPYERAEEYPACCYELPPDTILSNERLLTGVASRLASTLERLTDRGLEGLVVFLPRKHLKIWGRAREAATKWPQEIYVKYTLFSLGGLAEALSSLVPPGRDPG